MESIKTAIRLVLFGASHPFVKRLNTELVTKEVCVVEINRQLAGGIGLARAPHYKAPTLAIATRILPALR